MEISWDQLSEADWESLADHARAPMQQRWTYGTVHQALGGVVHRAVVREGGQPVAICQVICRRFGGFLNVGLALRGPLWFGGGDRAAAFGMIRHTIPLRRPRVRLFTLNAAQPGARLIPLMTPATIALCDLPMGPGDLHGKWRNCLKKSGKNDLTLRHKPCRPKALQALLAADAAQQKTKSFRALPAAFSLEWQNHAPEDLRLFTAADHGRVVASALFLRHGNTASYHIAHASERGRETGASRLLIWRAFQDFAGAGLTRVDLGPIDTEKAPGLARFKLGAGAHPCPTGPTVLAI